MKITEEQYDEEPKRKGEDLYRRNEELREELNKYKNKYKEYDAREQKIKEDLENTPIVTELDPPQ